MIKVALPNKGQLYEPTVSSLTSSGYILRESERRLSCVDPDNGVEFYFIRPADIPLYVSRGILDAGVTGKDFVLERGEPLNQLLDLDYGHSRLFAAVPEDSGITELEQLSGYAVATSFPNITKSLLPKAPESIIVLEGAVEISIRLGIAEAIIDIVGSGRTLKQERLKTVGAPLYSSNAALFTRMGSEISEDLRRLKNRLEGTMMARNYVMVDYDVPKEFLKQACKLTPAIESPTIMPLMNESWFAVRSMIPMKDAHRIADELQALGCKGIVLTRLESARI